MKNKRRVRIRTRPGEILTEEFLKPLDITAHALALTLRVPPSRIAGILSEKAPRAITADTALRLGRFFGTTAQFWLNLQPAYNLSVAEIESRKKIDQDVRPYAA